MKKILFALCWLTLLAIGRPAAAQERWIVRLQCPPPWDPRGCAGWWGTSERRDTTTNCWPCSFPTQSACNDYVRNNGQKHGWPLPYESTGYGTGCVKVDAAAAEGTTSATERIIANAIDAMTPRQQAALIGGIAVVGVLGAIDKAQKQKAEDDAARQAAMEAEAKAAQRAQEAERARQEEAERERVAEEERLKKEQDAKFISERNNTSLKGSISATPGLRGSGVPELGLLGRPAETVRDLSGPQAAWKQLHCAAYIAGSALAAIGKDPQEFSYLAGQASSALAGEQLGVDCGKAPPMPDPRGVAVDWDRLRQTQQRMIERAVTLAERIQAGQQARAKYETAAPEPTRALTPDEQRIQDAYRKQKENEARLAKGDAPVIAAQKAINRGQEPKYDLKDAAIIREEQKAKAELDKYVDAIKKLEGGDPSAVLGFGVDLTPAPKRPPRP